MNIISNDFNLGVDFSPFSVGVFVNMIHFICRVAFSQVAYFVVTSGEMYCTSAIPFLGCLATGDGVGVRGGLALKVAGPRGAQQQVGRGARFTASLFIPPPPD